MYYNSGNEKLDLGVVVVSCYVIVSFTDIKCGEGGRNVDVVASLCMQTKKWTPPEVLSTNEAASHVVSIRCLFPPISASFLPVISWRWFDRHSCIIIASEILFILEWIILILYQVYVYTHVQIIYTDIIKKYTPFLTYM